MSGIRDIIIENLIDTMPVGLMVLDKDGNIIVANVALSGILGYPLDELHAKGWGELFFTSDANADFNQVLIDLIDHKPVRLMRSVPYLNPDGAIRHLSITSSYLSSGDELGIVLLFEDVTEKHLLHEQERAMAARNEFLQQERLGGLHKLAMSVAHQIRNPVMTIGGFSQLLLRGEGMDAHQRERLSAILDESRRLEKVVGAVAAYASLGPPVCETVRVEAFAAVALDRAQALGAAQGRRVDGSLACGAAAMRVDPAQFRLCLDALVDNVLDFTGGDTVSVRLAAKSGGGACSLVVEDRGQGIAQSDMPFIYDPFFSTKAHGVGMGLTMVRRIVLEHQGELTVESRTDLGTRVTLRIPDAPDQGGMPGV
ncbi:MAG: nitrogen regulation protein NR(II) [Desulfovibrionaceae bacterium]